MILSVNDTDILHFFHFTGSHPDIKATTVKDVRSDNRDEHRGGLCRWNLLMREKCLWNVADVACFLQANSITKDTKVTTYTTQYVFNYSELNNLFATEFFSSKRSLSMLDTPHPS